MTFEARLQFLLPIDFSVKTKPELLIILCNKSEPGRRSDKSLLDQIDAVGVVPSFFLLVDLKRRFPFPAIPEVIGLSQLACQLFFGGHFAVHSEANIRDFLRPRGRKVPFVKLKFILHVSVQF